MSEFNDVTTVSTALLQSFIACTSWLGTPTTGQRSKAIDHSRRHVERIAEQRARLS